MKSIAHAIKHVNFQHYRSNSDSNVKVTCLPINDQCSPSYRNQSVDLQCKSMITYELQKYTENFSFQIFIIFYNLLLSFLFINKTLWLNNLNTMNTITWTSMNPKTSVFVICGEAIISLLLYNLHDCTFQEKN